jgi:hypothetical protein
MADNSDEEHLDNPTNNQSENLSSEIIPALDTETIIQNPETENMEVHHHAHASHGKKTWKDYFWEFLMLFLAVFCGFLAEYQLEHTIEKKRENKFIHSLIEDLKIDTTSINNAITYNTRRIKGMDSLAKFIWSTKITKAEAKRLYYLKFKYTGGFKRGRVTFSKSTITQLKYSGNLRLIENQHVIDSISTYDIGIEFIERAADNTQNSVTDNFKAEYDIFNDKFFFENLDTEEYREQDFDLLTYDSKVLTAYASRITHQRVGMNAYTQYIRNQKQKAINLIQLLTKEYHLN